MDDSDVGGEVVEQRAEIDGSLVDRAGVVELREEEVVDGESHAVGLAADPAHRVDEFAFVAKAALFVETHVAA